MRRFCLSVSVLLVAIVPSLAPADEWPGFLGVRRDGISPETGLIDTLPADGPKPIWRVPGGVGMSAVAVADGLAITSWNDTGKQWLVALDAATGKEAWKTQLRPGSGKELWRFPFETDFGCNTATPIVVDGGVFVSAGENHGSVLIDLGRDGDRYAPQARWESLGPKSLMRNEWQTSIVVGDHLYGFDNVGAAGPVTHLVCLEAKTGREVWRKPRFGKGNMVYADGKLWITTFEGELVLARATPAGYQELGRAELLGRTRQTLTIAGGRGYLRDDREVLCIGLE